MTTTPEIAKPEYQVRPVLRFVVTEFKDGVSRPLGEYDNRDLAWTVADGIAKANSGFACIPVTPYADLARTLKAEYPEAVHG